MCVHSLEGLLKVTAMLGWEMTDHQASLSLRAICDSDGRVRYNEYVQWYLSLGTDPLCVATRSPSPKVVTPDAASEQVRLVLLPRFYVTTL